MKYNNNNNINGNNINYNKYNTPRPSNMIYGLTVERKERIKIYFF